MATDEPYSIHEVSPGRFGVTDARKPLPILDYVFKNRDDSLACRTQGPRGAYRTTPRRECIRNGCFGHTFPFFSSDCPAKTHDLCPFVQVAQEHAYRFAFASSNNHTLMIRLCISDN